jgi:prephenate dehydratase
MAKMTAQTAPQGAQQARTSKPRVSYQGERGANSHIACNQVLPEYEPLPCATFEDALQAVKNGEADRAMIPIENTLAGRVADVHHLLPGSNLYIVGEHFLPIQFQVVAVPGATLDTITDVYSHVHALGQCRNIIRKNGWRAHVAGDTAGAARMVKEWNDPTKAAFAPRLAAEVYDLKILAEDVEDAKHNTTRFVVLSRDLAYASNGSGKIITSFVFRVRNVPAALYKAMGGFATNGVNMTKLESYQMDGQFTATMFYAEIDGHPDDANVARALEELSFFSTHVRIFGAYRASPIRAELTSPARG